MRMKLAGYIAGTGEMRNANTYFLENSGRNKPFIIHVNDRISLKWALHK